MIKPRLIAQVVALLSVGVVIVFLSFTKKQKNSEIGNSRSIEPQKEQAGQSDFRHESVTPNDESQSEPEARSERPGNRTIAKNADGSKRKEAPRIKTAVLPHLGPVKVLESRIDKNEGGEPTLTLLIEAPEGAKYPILRVVQKSEFETPEFMVADHVIAQFDAEVDEVELGKSLATKGLSIRRKLVNPGLYVIASSEVTLDTVPDSLQVLQELGAIAVEATEPDYLAFPTDGASSSLSGDIDSDSGEGRVVWNPERASFSDPDRGESSAELLKARIAAASGFIKPAFSANRTLTFDPPFFLGGEDSYAPYAREQKFQIRFPYSSGVRIESGDSTQPDNGSLYANLLSFYGGAEIVHSEGLPFTLSAMDLAESSSTVSGTYQPVFTAIREDGSTFTHSVTLDGLGDGDGPVDDWETFNFGSIFENIVSLKISGSFTYIAMDNVQLTVHGAETPELPKPAYPLVYDIDFSEPEHKLNQTIEVGGHYAPKTIRMGNPIVRSTVGPLTDQPVELKLGDGGFNTSSNYEQILMGMGFEASAYRFEMDLMVDSLGPNIYSDSFTIHFDREGGGIQRIDFEEDNDIRVWQSGVSGAGGDKGHYVPGQKHHLRVDIDMEAGTWIIFLDGNQIHSGPFDSSADIRNIRVHFSDSSGGSALAAVDNIKISAFEPGGLADPFEPKLNLSPLSINFGDVRQGSIVTRTVRLRNTGQAELEVSALSVNRTQLSIVNAAAPFSIPPRSFRDVLVRFSPTTIGSITGALTVFSNDPTNPTQSVTLVGNGISTQALAVSDNNITVSVNPEQTTSFNLALNNNGGSQINWTVASTGGSTSEVTPPTPNDPALGLLWGMRDPADFGSGIAAEKAWAVTTGSDRIVVGVIDTGVAWDHPDLASNIWTNEDEIPGNGVDDDNNGFIDDIRGWDFYGNDANPTDTSSGHGTHVAGTIAAIGDNGTGVSGVAWKAQVMPIRFLGPWGGSYSDAIDSVDYATQNGARITNNSWGGGSYSFLLRAAIGRALSQDRLFVAAAGNDGFNADSRPMYPAAYSLSNIVSVAATDVNDALAYFSNYGATSVDLAAPGVSIYSTFLRGGYQSLSGTSMASPHVAGAAVLLLAQDAGRTFYETKQLLLDHVDVIPAMNGRAISNGRLNILNSLGGIPNASWLSFASNSGSLSGGASGVIQLNFDSTGLSSGRYTEILTLTSNDPIRPTIEIPVSFEVSGAAASSFTGPAITSQPLDTEVAPGGNTLLSVSASANAGSLSYKWFRGAVGYKATQLGNNSATLNLVNVTTESSYWVEVSDDQGSSFSNGADVSLGGAPLDPPDPPQNLTATDGVSSGPVALNWTAGLRATSYRVYRNTLNNSGTATLLGEVSVTNFNDSTAAPFVTYYYWASSVNSTGASNYSGSDSGFRTLAAPGGLSASDGTSGVHVALSWQASPGASGYRVYRHSSNSFGDSAMIANVVDSSFNDTSGDASTVYYYWVEAYTGGGSSTVTGPDTGFRTLSPPTNISASDGTSENFVSITWETADGASGYRVYRHLSNLPGSSVQIGDVSGLNFNDSTVTPGVNHRYWVRAYSGSATSSLIGPDTGHRALSSPENLSASSGFPTSHVAVTWNASDGATSYQIFRNTSNTLSGVQLLSTLSGLSYNDGSAVPGVAYFYWIKARTSLATSEYSVSVSGTRYGGATWDEYKQENGINSYADDLDGDGETALIEWALGGTNPNSSLSSPAYYTRIRDFSGTDYFTINFMRLLGGNESGNTYTVHGHVYECRGSTGLGIWDQTPISVSPPNDLPTPPEGYAWSSFRLPFGIDSTKGFMNVTIEPLPE